MSTMRPLRDEHREMLLHIEEIRRVADAVGSVPPETLLMRMTAVSAFMSERLIPHARAEESVLYPEVERAMAAPRATAALARDHVEIVTMAGQLRELERRLRGGDRSAALETDARRVLYGLYALVKLHFAEEEEIFVPVLEQALDDDQAHELFERMRTEAASAYHLA